MRRYSSATFVSLAALFLFTALWTACGGGSSNDTTNAVTKITFNAASYTLEPGQVVTISATPYNASGTTVSTTVTYTSSDTTNAAISPGGSLCAGSWDSTFTQCTPAKQVGQYTITATANDFSATANAFIHFHVDAVYAHAPGTACTSSGQTAGVKAYACASKTNFGGTCSATCPDNPNLCDISDNVGSFNFGVIDSSVATIDSTGKLTAAVPGITKVYASVTNGGGNATTSVAVPYTTCLVDSIKLHVKDKTDTSFAVAKTKTVTLAADAVDTAGATVTSNLTYNTLQSVVGTVVAGSPTSTGTYTGVAPGYGAVVASCTPPNCNKNADAVFSNVAVTTVRNSSTDSNVTANSTTIYATGVGAVQMYPVDSTKRTLGTVLSLPFPANSLLASHDGTHMYVGSDSGAMVVGTSGNSVQTLSFSGKALAVAPNDAYVIFANTDSSNNGQVNIMSGSSLTIANPGGFSIPGVKAASFTPDGNTVYFATSGAIYRYRIASDTGSIPTPLSVTGGGNPLPNAAHDLTTSANGSILFTSTTPQIVANESCSALVNGAYTTAFEALGTDSFTSPTMLTAMPNGTGILAVDGGTVDRVTISSPNPSTTPFSGCPAKNFATSQSTINLSALGSGFSINKLVMSHSGKYLAVLPDCTGGCVPKVGIVDLTNGTVHAVPLAQAGAVPKQIVGGDFLLDDSSLWVGADDNYLHQISISKLQDVQRVQVQVQAPSSGGNVNYVAPGLIAIQPK